MKGFDSLQLDTSSTWTTIVSIIWIVLIVAAEWKIFEKAGEEGWKAIIPFYNSYIFYQLTTGHGWLFILQYIPVIGLFARVYAQFKLSKVFGHGLLVFIGLLIIAPICELILGFGDDQYHPELV